MEMIFCGKTTRCDSVGFLSNGLSRFQCSSNRDCLCNFSGNISSILQVAGLTSSVRASIPANTAGYSIRCTPFGRRDSFFASDFTRIFLGEQWLLMFLAMQILVVYGLSRMLVANTGSLFQAMGQLELSTKLQFLKLLLLAVIIYPLTKYGGIPGIALAVGESGILVDICFFRVAYKTIHCSIRDLAKSILSLAFVTASTLILLEITGCATRVSVQNIALFV